MIKVSDYIFKRLSEYGVRHVFMITGGGAMHLNDSVGRCPGLDYICPHHEQAAAMAAEGYARLTNEIGVAVVTSGPGGTNAITGVMGAWVDSVPMLVLSGQVKTETTIINAPGMRQLGDQEINIVDIVRPVTKYSVMVINKNEIRYHLDKALYLANSGRPGPVWLDIPLDIQAAMVEEDELDVFNESGENTLFDKDIVGNQCQEVVAKILQAKRPVIIVGNGVRLAGATNELTALINKLGIPVLTAISGIDLMAGDSELFFGRPGIIGARAANFIMQNSDLLLIIGTRMNLRAIGYAYDTFARDAFKIAVDIDVLELNKPTLNLDLKIHSDAAYFIKSLSESFDGIAKQLSFPEWLVYCNKCKNTFPVVDQNQRDVTDYVSSYVFAESLSEVLNDEAIVVTGNGTAYTSTYQSFKVKSGQRMFANVGCASMGYDLPAAIGASVASNCGEVICITGDGSIQMNIQELQTIVNYNLPIKIFVFNNDGYLSIKTTQSSFFSSNFVGSTPDTGIRLPDLEKISSAYGIPYQLIKNHAELESGIKNVISCKGAIICEVSMDPFEKLYPKASSMKLANGTMISKPLEDLFPFLSREQFAEFMIVEPVKE